MSHVQSDLAASEAANSALRGTNATLRCQIDHLKAIVRLERGVQLAEERLMLIATTNRWSTDFQGCVE